MLAPLCVPEELDFEPTIRMGIELVSQEECRALLLDAIDEEQRTTRRIVESCLRAIEAWSHDRG
jgi:hypothetical protein